MTVETVKTPPKVLTHFVGPFSPFSQLARPTIYVRHKNFNSGGCYIWCSHSNVL